MGRRTLDGPIVIRTVSEEPPDAERDALAVGLTAANEGVKPVVPTIGRFGPLRAYQDP